MIFYKKRANSNADVAELADAHDSGSCARKGVEVQLLSSALCIIDHFQVSTTILQSHRSTLSFACAIGVIESFARSHDCLASGELSSKKVSPTTEINQEVVNSTAANEKWLTGALMHPPAKLIVSIALTQRSKRCVRLFTFENCCLPTVDQWMPPVLYFLPPCRC